MFATVRVDHLAEGRLVKACEKIRPQLHPFKLTFSQFFLLLSRKSREGWKNFRFVFFSPRARKSWWWWLVRTGERPDSLICDLPLIRAWSHFFLLRTVQLHVCSVPGEIFIFRFLWDQTFNCLATRSGQPDIYGWLLMLTDFMVLLNWLLNIIVRSALPSMTLY